MTVDRGDKVRGAHGYTVLVIAFCDHELLRDRLRQTPANKVRFGRMPKPARYKRALPR